MKKMRIAIFTDTFYPEINGIVTSTLDLARGLAKRGHKIYIIAPKKYFWHKEFRFKNIIVKRIHGIPAIVYKGFKFTSIFNPSILNYLIKENIDVIHLQTPFTIGASAIVLNKILKAPLVGTFHTMVTSEEYRKHLGLLSAPALNSFFWAYARAYYNKCNLITCPSKSIKDELIKQKFKKNIEVISNGINPRVFNNSKKIEVKRKYNPNGPIVLFVGRIAYEKNVYYLLDCLKKVADKIKNAKFLIIGDGPQMKEFKSKIESMGLKERVILTGSIKHEDLIKSSIFKACDIFVTASLTETQGITLMEAQANGLPSVGVDANGTRDLIKNGYNGFLVKKGDKKEFARAVVKILSDKKLYKKMQKSAFEEIRKHYLKNIILRWEQEYSHLVNKRENYIKKNKKKSLAQTLFTNMMIKKLKLYDLIIPEENLNEK